VTICLTAIAANQALNFGLLDSWLQARFGVRREDPRILQVTFTPILLGVLCAHLLHTRAAFERCSSLLARRWSAPVMLVLLAVACVTPVELGLPRLVVQLCMTLLLASCVMTENHLLRPILTWAPIRRVGVISYGMYLFHMWVRHPASLLLDRWHIETPLALFPLMFFGTLLLAELSYRYFESPLLRLRNARFGR
jgi:peptidoglycan/LPS O-acetylase OafA/YrhL